MTVSFQHSPSSPAIISLQIACTTLLVWAMVPERHVGSQSGSESDRHQPRILGRRYTRTVNSCMMWWTPLNLSEMGRLSAGSPVGRSVNLYTALAFAVRLQSLIKIAQLTSNDTFLNTLQVATLAILEWMFFLLCVIFRCTNVVNSTVISAYIHAMPWLPNIHDQRLLTLNWQSFSEEGNDRVIFFFAYKGSHYTKYA